MRNLSLLKRSLRSVAISPEAFLFLKNSMPPCIDTRKLKKQEKFSIKIIDNYDLLRKVVVIIWNKNPNSMFKK